jgi:enoyl-[acyl-carrier protein] reductase I
MGVRVASAQNALEHLGFGMQGLMQGRRGLIMGVANDHSIAWGIARILAAHGATLAFTYQGEALGKRVRPLAQSLGADLLMTCDVEDVASVDKVFETIGEKWGGLDFLVHAVAFSDKNELKGRYADTSRANFVRTMLISCFSFTEAAKRAAALMTNGGAMVTLTYNGGTRAMPNYNAMGLAKAALEASVRYLAVDFGGHGIRVNAISAGPIRTLAGAGISDARFMFAYQQRHSPLHRGVTLDELGGAALYLLSDLSTGVTGEIHFVDSGYNAIAMPQPEALRVSVTGNGNGNGNGNINNEESAKDAAQ